jgi:hypothetical protein
MPMGSIGLPMPGPPVMASTTAFTVAGENVV